MRELSKWAEMPNIYRNSVGLDTMLDRLQHLAGHAGSSFPPYNIIQDDENKYTATFAVAGYKPEELEVMQEDNVLVIAGKSEEDDEDVKYLHRGIARRSFNQKLVLAEDVKINDVELKNGMLYVRLERVVPEEKQPRKIDIRVAD